ncbi:MAG: hypothetical protein HRT89_11815, partial [Lentisphaeria bacterium]|nr:hypothetical protein [Lentisphaeria bacterium]
TVEKGQKTVWRYWGTPENPLKTQKGINIYERMNIPKWLRENPSAEIPFMQISHSRFDNSISFEGYPDYYRALQEARQPFTASWVQSGHLPTGDTGSNMLARKILKNESVPAFSWATCNTPIEKEPVMTGDPVILAGQVEIVDGKTLKLISFKKLHKKTVYKTFPKELKGKWLLMDYAPYSPGGPNFQIESVTDTTLTVIPDPHCGDLNSAAFARNIKNNKHKFFISDVRLMGRINSALEWSSSLQNFDKKSKADDIVDTAKRYEISLRLFKAKNKRLKYIEFKPNEPDATCTADVTPRRLQQFKAKSGQKVAWQNVSLADPAKPKVIASGTITVDKYGLVTVKKFLIGKKGLGNRLVLEVK